MDQKLWKNLLKSEVFLYSYLQTRYYSTIMEHHKDWVSSVQSQGKTGAICSTDA